MKHSTFSIAATLSFLAGIITLCVCAVTGVWNAWALIGAGFIVVFAYLTYVDEKAAHAEMVRQLAEERP